MDIQNENNTPDANLLRKVQHILNETCGSLQNCNEKNVQSFLEQCERQSIDPQFCMNWLEENKGEIPNWSVISNTAQDWVVQHTSTGSPVVDTDETLK